MIVARPIITAGLIPARLICPLLVCAGLICPLLICPLLICARLSGALICTTVGAIVFVTARLILAGLAGPVITTIGLITTVGLIAARIITAGLIAAGLRAHGFGKFNQSVFIIANDGEAIGMGGIAVDIRLLATALIAAIVAPVIAVIAVALPVPIAVLWIAVLRVTR